MADRRSEAPDAIQAADREIREGNDAEGANCANPNDDDFDGESDDIEAEHVHSAPAPGLDLSTGDQLGGQSSYNDDEIERRGSDQVDL